MNLTITHHHGMTLLLAEGSVEDNDLKKICMEIGKLPASQEKFILLDCVDLKKIIYSSIGFSGLVNYLLELRAMNTRMILFCYDNLTYRLLKMLKMDDMFHYSNTLDEAYLNLKKIIEPQPLSAKPA